MCLETRPRTRTRPAALALAALLVALLAAPLAAGQEPAPLYVSFDFGDYPGAAGLFDAAARARVVRGLVEVAGSQGRLPYWHFLPAGAGDYPRLAVRVARNGGDYDLVATLEIVPGDHGHGSWDGALFTAAELVDEDGFPAPSRVPARIVEAFDRRVLTEARVTPDGGEAFVRLTELVPVGSRAHLAAGERSGMVGLDRSRFAALALSTFKLVCRKANGTVVALYSKGTGERLDFPDPPFPAIAVELARWQEGAGGAAEISAAQLAALGDLSTSGVFLVDFDPDGLVLAASEGGTPPPSLAPPVEGRTP